VVAPVGVDRCRQTDHRIAYRIGINQGDVIVEDAAIFAEAINIAARLQALARPGGISVSDAVFRNVRGKLNLGFADIGPQSVKNIADPVPVYQVLLDPADAGKVLVAKRPRAAISGLTKVAAVVALLLVAIIGGLWWRPWVSTGAGKPTIAVLPFENVSRDPPDEYLARGVAGDLFTDISSISGLLVAAWEASSRVKPSGVDVQAVGRKLKVAYILTGDIRRTGNVLRINVRLVDVSTGFNLWAGRYDRGAEQIFDLQDDITRNVVKALKLNFSRAERAVVSRRRTANPAAYDLVLKARSAQARFSLQSNAEAIALYRRAIELDPNYAQAHVELAYGYFFKWFITRARDASTLEIGTAFARKALTIDPSLPTAHTALGWFQLWRRNYDEAIRSMKKAVELDPNNGEALARLALAYVMAGKPAEGLKSVWLARARTTYEPAIYGFYAALSNLYLDRREDALRELKRSLSVNPRLFVTHRVLAVVYVEMGRIEDARAAAKETLRLNPRMSISLARRQLPYKKLEDLERQLTAMRKAGFPE